MRGCDGIVDFGENEPRCNNCNNLFCKECKLKSHQGKSCEEGYGFNFREWRRCPNCRVFNERADNNKIRCECQQ